MADNGRLQRFVSWLTEPIEQRSHPLDPDIHWPDIDTQLYARQQAQAASVMKVTIKEALGIPAIWRGISLLSTVAASLQLKEYRNEIEIPAAPVVRRPQRRWTPGAFTRDTVMYMASRGESIWLVTERSGGYASDLLPVPPETLQSDWNGLDHDWYTIGSDGRRRDYRPENVVHIPLIRDPVTGRGIGPLQACGVALNVAVEAERWASRFYVGSVPSVYLESRVPLAGNDPATIKEKWLQDPPNVPKVGYGITPHQIGMDMENAQAIQSRMYSRGDAALILGIPGRMMEYAESGASITYANVGDLATELVRLTLGPAYLEQIEQAFSDQRPRGTEVRYDVEGFERADVKTRYQIHQQAIASGIYDAQYAAQKEGVSGSFPEVRPAPMRLVSNG